MVLSPMLFKPRGQIIASESKPRPLSEAESKMGQDLVVPVNPLLTHSNESRGAGHVEHILVDVIGRRLDWSRSGQSRQCSRANFLQFAQ